MKQEDLIAMAREAGFITSTVDIDGGHSMRRVESVARSFAVELERFASLVAARTREECAALVQENADACDPGSLLQIYLASNAAAIRSMGEQT